MEEKLLYPQYPIMRICFDGGDEIHSLAKVLATWGGTIRDIVGYRDCFEVRCYTGDSSGRTGSCFLRIPRDPNCDTCREPIDLIVKYKREEDGSLSSPVCVGTISVFELYGTYCVPASGLIIHTKTRIQGILKSWIQCLGNYSYLRRASIMISIK